MNQTPQSDLMREWNRKTPSVWRRKKNSGIYATRDCTLSDIVLNIFSPCRVRNMVVFLRSIVYSVMQRDDTLNEVNELTRRIHRLLFDMQISRALREKTHNSTDSRKLQAR